MATPVATQDIPNLLRFLTQDAKVPLSTAMSKVKALQAANLVDVASISSTGTAQLKAIFTDDEKVAKQVLNAAKRATKRKAQGASDGQDGGSPAKKRQKTIEAGTEHTPAQLEEALALPEPCMDEELISNTVLITNRAPLVLAFAVMLLKYTMPGQPLSSRLSLAQAVVSANSRTKAVSIGLESGKSAEEEGWGKGQPGVKIMGREIRVLKRWGYQAEDGLRSENALVPQAQQENNDIPEAASQVTQDTVAEVGNSKSANEETPLWGLDLEALKKSNSSAMMNRNNPTGSTLPIYTPQSARSYLLKSFARVPMLSSDNDLKDAESSNVSRKENTILKERNLGLLLGAIDLLYQSWANLLSKDDLDRRAWSWYVHVRPDVQNGVAGWGGKGEVRLAEILDLRTK